MQGPLYTKPMKPSSVSATATSSQSTTTDSSLLSKRWSADIIHAIEEEVLEEISEEEEVLRALQTLTTTELRPYRFHKASSEWRQDEEGDCNYSGKRASGSSSSSISTNTNGSLQMRTISFVSYNVWFGTRRETKEELRPRFEALFEIVHKKDPDVVCFQEMTSNIISLLMDQPWVRENYWISDTDQAHTFLGYGILILSRLPYKKLTLQELPTQLGRKLLILELCINNQSFAVATSHLESYTKDGPIRAKQLRIIYHLLQEGRYDHAVLMGDFNFVDEAERERNMNKDYRDQWLTIKGPNDPGYSYDMKRNLMLKRMNRAKKARVRIDLILSRSKGSVWRPKDVEQLGTEPINGTVPESTGSGSSSSESDSGSDSEEDEAISKLIYPSDHFGLYGTLEYVGE